MADPEDTESAVEGAPQISGYLYLRPLGQGGTCWVYLYRQLEPRRLVAVKVSKRRASDRSHALFLKEATFMARLSAHPAILTILSAGVSHDGRDYIVMEYAPGGNYKRIMKTTRLDERGALDLGVRIASALYAAHQQGIIHRDVKPGNFLVTTRGLPVLSDFGISASTYTASQAKGLSVPWAAPEIIAHKSGGSEASDIYSLGASIFGLLTGKSPYEYGFRVRDEQELAQLIEHEGPPRLRRGEASPDFERVLDKAMAHDREERYFSSLDFGRDMQVLQARLYGHMTPLVARGADPYPSQEELGMAGRLSARKQKRDATLATTGAGDGNTDLGSADSEDLDSAEGGESGERARIGYADGSGFKQSDGRSDASKGESDGNQADARAFDEDQAPATAARVVRKPSGGRIATSTNARRPVSARTGSAGRLDALGGSRPAAPEANRVKGKGSERSELGWLRSLRAQPAHARGPSSASGHPISGQQAWGLRRAAVFALACLLAAVLSLGVGFLAAKRAGEAGGAAGTGNAGFSASSSLPSSTGSSGDQIGQSAPASVPTVTAGRGDLHEGLALFSWSNPAPEPGDAYLWKTVPATAPEDGQADWRGAERSSEPKTQVNAGQERAVCIQVALLRADQRISNQPARICATLP
ncbi:serine/threonine protein kinase [Bifidobacterium actinocoloniiforme DSM 22766]|uniref:non-specific serine/threonine protein kinase n=1 Tax=Bifidobacterium actinocoloniiforme DSM 22766 TaxID=1437605 RepID=A0A086YZG7_9BIFI|nr:serine/threonine-protein kinase [Bifidobacterium actinocoloniiforme]KFI39667.1 serine/threonine protein kinase [Bifidobacterium actinocoloniiforme DSM 22766]